MAWKRSVKGGINPKMLLVIAGQEWVTNQDCGLVYAVTLSSDGCRLAMYCKLCRYFHDEYGEVMQPQAVRMVIMFGMDGRTLSVGQHQK